MVSMKDYAQQNDITGIGGVFDVAQALHWYCVNWHAGQSSDLYRIQCQLNYRPGMSESGPEDGIAADTYADLEAGHLDPQDVADWVEATYATEAHD